MLVAIIIALAFASATVILFRGVFINWIENEYNSESTREERYQEYIADLQMFVDKNALSSEDTAQITRWVRNNRNIYLFIYKDDQLFFDSSIAPVPDDDKIQDEEKEEAGNDMNDADGDSDASLSGNENVESY